MKSYLSITILLFTLISCQTDKTSELKKPINDWIQKNTDNPDSYEEVEFKITDTISLNAENDSVYESMRIDSVNYANGIAGYEKGLMILDRAIGEGKISQSEIEEAKPIRLIVIEGKKTIEELSKKMQTRKNKFFDKQIIEVELKYRMLNTQNAKELMKKTFLIDSESNEIVEDN